MHDSKPTPGPWAEVWFGSGPERGRWVRQHTLSNVPMIARVSGADRMLDADSEEADANAHLIAAAGTAASEVADMGYDPVEAVKALPQALRALVVAREFVKQEYHSEQYIAEDGEYVAPEARPLWYELADALARAYGQGGDDGNR